MSQTNFNLPSIYNPATQTSEEIISNFVVRLTEFNELFNAVNKDKMKKPPQHYLIQGQRGYGKTTLLLRLNIEIKKDKGLSKWLVPVMFNEEQYGMLNLAKLWEEIIEMLENDYEDFTGLTEKLDSFYETNNPEEKIYNFLITELKKRKKKIVVLLDNFGDRIRNFTKKDNQRLREVLITCNHIRFIGASSVVLEFYYDYKQAFYDFFKVITLDELDKEETILLLKKLGETYKSEEINKIISEQPERIEILRRLTGGVPRTIVMLFQIFVDDENGTSINTLEVLLDKVTPLYKHRLDNLSPQQQAIMDAIAQNWDALSTKEISKRVRMPSKAVSSQLNQLEKSQLIKKIPTSTKNHLYQISERFFNIFYLMRLGRKKNRNRVIWLIKFLETWCSQSELIARANKHLESLEKNKINEKYVYYFGSALAATSIPWELQDKLIKESRKYLESSKSSLSKELYKSHLEVMKEAKQLIQDSKDEEAVNLFVEDGFNKNEAIFSVAYIYEEYSDFKKAEKYYLMAVDKNDVDAMFNLGTLYDMEFKDFGKAEKYYLMAVDKNDVGAMYNLGILYHLKLNNFKKAEKYYQLAIENNHYKAMHNLGALYLHKGIKSDIALSLSERSYTEMGLLLNKLLYAKTLLWNNKFEDAFKLEKDFLEDSDFIEDQSSAINDFFIMLMAKKQYNFTYKIFKENKHQIKEKLLPTYYALLKLMGEKYADEFKKMPSELEETVEEIIEKVKQWEEKYKI